MDQEQDDQPIAYRFDLPAKDNRQDKSDLMKGMDPSPEGFEREAEFEQL